MEKEELAKLIIDSYKKGYGDAVECLKHSLDSIDIDRMKKQLSDKLLTP